MDDTHAIFEFNYASFILKPYSGDNSTSSTLLKSLMQDMVGKSVIHDRYQGRKGNEKRRLVNISCRFAKGGNRCFGRIALIKNKAPKLWAGKDIVEDIDNPKNKEFIEVTNYVVNFNTNSDPVIMYEWNSSGARLSDIEYYFRQISNSKKEARSITTSIHLDIDTKELDKALSNVLSLTVKVNSGSLTPNWLKSLRNLKDDSGFKDVRIELFFKRQKDGSGGILPNVKGLDYARNMLSWLKKDSNNLEKVDDLKMDYQLSGSDEVLGLDFLKNKKTSIIGVPYKDGKKFARKTFNEVVGNEFNQYLQTGNTTDITKD